MSRLLLICGLAVIAGVCILVDCPFIPFHGMILIGVGLVLPIQFL